MNILSMKKKGDRKELWTYGKNKCTKSIIFYVNGQRYNFRIVMSI